MPILRRIFNFQFSIYNLVVFLILFSIFFFLFSNSVLAQQNPHPCSQPHISLFLNDRGDCVKHLQWYLNRVGLGTTLTEDGIFGSRTLQAVQTYQVRNGLNDTGIADQPTWASLHSRFAGVTASPTASPTGTTQFELPPGQPLTLERIMNEMLVPFANFLVTAGIILAVIAIVWSGITYFRAGGEEKKVEAAKRLFKNGLIGALIILGVGVIINTIAAIVTGGFFNFIPGR